jgi:hypothetical protein
MKEFSVHGRELRLQNEMLTWKTSQLGFLMQ